MYCIINENFGIVARIDRSDWKEYMAARMFKSVEEGLEFMSLQSDSQLADIYRRKFSQDSKLILDNLYNYISSSDPKAASQFVEKDEFAKLKKQYKQDCEQYSEPWKLWQVKTKNSNANFTQCSIKPMFLSSNEYRRLTPYFVLVGDIVYEYAYENSEWDKGWFDKGVASFSLQELEEKYNFLANKVKESNKQPVTTKVFL